MNIIVIGSGGHAGVVLNAIERMGTYYIQGLLDDFAETGSNKHGYEIVGKVSSADLYASSSFFVAVGDNRSRELIVGRITAFQFPAVIHPSATVASHVFKGCYVGAGAHIGTNCEVGEFSIINTHASLDHDSKVGRFSHLAPGVITGGRVTIGDRTLIGIGACIRDGVCIGNNCTIGMGSVVIEDVADESTVVGNPARLVPEQVMWSGR